MTAKDVEEVILTPMVRLYAAPAQLRGHAKDRSEALREYVRCLERYPRSALERIWRMVVEEYIGPNWPTPGVLVAAGRRVYRGPMELSEEELKTRRAKEMADRYSARFMRTSQVAKLARREGWIGHLRTYVEAAAWVQAQLISGVRDVGFDSVLTRHLGDFDSARESLESYLESAWGAVSRGQVRVSIPKQLIATWRSFETGKQAR